MAVLPKIKIDPALEKPASPFLVGSALIHGVIILLLIVGLPYVTPDRPLPDAPVPIELVDLDEITQTTAAAKKANDETKKAKPAKKEPTEPKPKPSAPQVTAKTPPKPGAPKPPEETVTIPEKTKAPEPVKKPVSKPKAPEKPKERLLTASDDESQEDFQSLLRNLMPDESEAEATQNAAGEKPRAFVPLGERMTISEQDALRRQLAACWNLLAGARFAEDLVVEIKLFMNADRSIREARIVNQLRYNQDSFFRAAADSALRALYNPQCTPLDLPPEKYEQWKIITVTFDPRSML